MQSLYKFAAYRPDNECHCNGRNHKLTLCFTSFNLCSIGMISFSRQQQCTLVICLNKKGLKRYRFWWSLFWGIYFRAVSNCRYALICYDSLLCLLWSSLEVFVQWEKPANECNGPIDEAHYYLAHVWSSLLLSSNRFQLDGKNDEILHGFPKAQRKK